MWENGTEMIEIAILPCIEGAKQAEGLTIIVDVFRAGNTAAALLEAGSPFIIPAAELEEARALKKDHPEWLLVGERGGLRPNGFDLNNSPARAVKMNLNGRPSIFTTSAGTRGLVAASKTSDHLMMATLVNAGAAAALVHSLGPQRVTIVPIGLEGKEPAAEDDAVAVYLKSLISGGKPDYRSTVRAMLQGDGASRLRRLKQWRDLAWCLLLDKSETVPVASLNDPERRLVLTATRPSGSIRQ